MTEEFFTPDLIKNLGMLRKFAKLPRALLKPSLHAEFLSHLESSKPYPWTTAECLKKIALRLCISYTDARDIYFHLIWNKSIKIDLFDAPIRLTAPLPKFEVVETDSLDLIREGSL